MWECSVEERMDVRQRSRGVGGVLWWKSEDAYFVAEHTLLQGCQAVAAVLVKCTAIIAYCELSVGGAEILMYLTMIIQGLVACCVLCVGGRDHSVPDQVHPRACGFLSTMCWRKSP